MTFSPTTLLCLIPRIGSGPAVWNYTTTDAHTDVDVTDYFALGGKKYGMKVGDVVFVHDTDAPSLTIHRVTDIDSDGNATISVATLS